MPEIPAAPVHFKEAIDFLKDKTNIPTRTWTDIWEGQHSRAFVVAGAMKADLVADFHDAVNSAIANGTTLQTFREDFDRIVEKHGWSYNGGRNWRSRVIFQTNLRTAYNAGRYAQAQATKARRPYMRYVAVLDDRTRPEHRQWHGTILPVDDPWWATHHPPNGWNCRCTTQTLSDRDLKDNGWEVDEEAPPVKMEDKTINTADGQVTVQVPEGIDAGFGYNPGASAFGRGKELIKLDAHGDDWLPLVAPGAPTYQLAELPTEQAKAALGPPGREANQASLQRALKDAIGGDERVFDDPAGGQVLVNQALVDHILQKPSRMADGRVRYWPLIPEVIQDPQEVWLGFAQNKATGQVAVRRRYVKKVELEKGKPLLLVADQEGGYWQGLTFFPMQGGYVKSARSGYRIFSKVRG